MTRTIERRSQELSGRILSSLFLAGLAVTLALGALGFCGPMLYVFGWALGTGLGSVLLKGVDFGSDSDGLARYVLRGTLWALAASLGVMMASTPFVHGYTAPFALAALPVGSWCFSVGALVIRHV